MFNSKGGFLFRFVVNSVISLAIGYVALYFSWIKLGSELSNEDLTWFAVTLLVIAPAAISILAGMAEGLGCLVQVLSLGLFGALVRIGLWGALIWFLPMFSQVYRLNFDLNTGWWMLATLAIAQALLKLKAES